VLEISSILSFRVHVKLCYRIVSYYPFPVSHELFDKTFTNSIPAPFTSLRHRGIAVAASVTHPGTVNWLSLATLRRQRLDWNFIMLLWYVSAHYPSIVASSVFCQMS